MSTARTRLFFDYVDPGSWLMDLRAARVVGGALERVPFEVRPPPEPLVDPREAGWVAYWNGVARELEREGRALRQPPLVPWTRKAHELRLHAGAGRDGSAVHEALFRRFHEGGEDIGRVDVLLEVAAAAGLGYTETKAVLDVDRYAQAVAEARGEALDAGVRGVPTLMLGPRVLEGIHDDETIRAFLGGETVDGTG